MAARIFKPDNFHGTIDEDAEAWLSHFEKVANANGWTPAEKLRMAPVFLKDAAERWFLRTNFTAWAGEHADDEEAEPIAQQFSPSFLNQYNTEFKKSKWNDQFDNLRQGRKQIEEFNEEFLRLWRKVDPEKTYPAEILIRKYLRALKPETGAHVYI